MKNFNFKIPERKFHHNELPTFVIDETNKTLFFSFLMLSFGILFSIKTMNIHIVLITLGLVVMYAAAFFYFFYRHFIYDNLLIYDGYVTYYDDEDSSARNIMKQLANRYIRKYYTIETISDQGQDTYTLKTVIKGVKLKKGMKVRLYVLPDSIIKNRDQSFNVATVYTDILETPNKKKGKK